MAKNYTFAEVVRIINAGTDLEAITDIGRRFPALLHKVTKVTTKAGEDFVDLMGYMPDYLTANKVNSALKNTAGTTEADAEDADTDTEETTEAAETAEATTEAPDYESMSAKQLWDILGKAGLRKTAKSTKKADLVAACLAMDAAKAGATEAETDEAETETDTDADTAESTETNPYDGKSAMDLFKECKKRGIKAAPKKPAKFYADLLVKADAEAAEEADTESDDWDEEATEEAKPEPKATKKAEKPAKKAAKKDEAADDDDDWDI